MSVGLFAINVGEFGWELLNWQAHVRYQAREKGYKHVVICTDATSFDLYRDFAHEFITHDYPGIALCQHRRIRHDMPRIDAHWFKTKGCKEYEPWKVKGYDLLLPPEQAPDVRNMYQDQDFIKFGTKQDTLAYDVVVHARTRNHMNANNWPTTSWDELIGQFISEGLKVASIGITGSSYAVRGTTSYLDAPLRTTMDVMASSKMVMGPSSGPICLASLCGTPHMVWFGGNKYAGAGLMERFTTFWNPLKTKVWPLKIGWKPAVELVCSHALGIYRQLSPNGQDTMKSTRQRRSAKPADRPVVQRGPSDNPATQSRLAIRAAKVQERRKAIEERRKRTADLKAAQENVRKSQNEEALPEILDECLLIRVAPGIGDFSWVYTKLSTLKLPLNVQICGGGPARTAPFAEILPYCKHSTYGRLPFPTLRRRAISSTASMKELLEYYPNKVMHIECNSHLEGGGDIRKWLPELETDYHYDLNISAENVAAAEELLPEEPFIAIFAASDRGVKNWGAWNEFVWRDFILDFKQRVANMPFVLIGADWDKSLGYKISHMAKSNDVKLINLIGKLHIGASLHVIRKSFYFVSFPSGLGILSAVMSEPCTMFYPSHLDKMMGTYADPKLIEDKTFRELLFDTPGHTINWLLKEYQIKERLP